MPPARQMTGCGQSDLRRRVAQPRSELRLRPPGEPSAPVPEGITRVACFPTGRGVVQHRSGPQSEPRPGYPLGPERLPLTPIL